MDCFIYADKFFLQGRCVGPGFLEIKDGKFASFSEDIHLDWQKSLIMQDIGLLQV